MPQMAHGSKGRYPFNIPQATKKLTRINFLPHHCSGVKLNR